MGINVNGLEVDSVYCGAVPIAEVYNGAQPVWTADAYDKGHIFVEANEGKTFEVTLEKGTYYVEVTGGGGSSNFGWYYICFNNSGGSGASCYGEFYNPKQQTFTLCAGGGSGISYMNIGDTRVLTANNGNGCAANGACGGNTGGKAVLDFSSELVENISVEGHDGLSGSYAENAAPAPGASVSPHGWGVGATSSCGNVGGTVGGIFLQYVRHRK